MQTYAAVARIRLLRSSAARKVEGLAPLEQRAMLAVGSSELNIGKLPSQSGLGMQSSTRSSTPISNSITRSAYARIQDWILLGRNAPR